MIALLSDIGRFGQAAVRIRDGELLVREVGLEVMLGGTQGRREVEARQQIAYRVWTEVESSTLLMIARMIGRRDHSAAIHAILKGAAMHGITASRVSDLRERDDPVDWTKLAYAAAGWRAARDLTLERAAREAGVGRGEWRKIETGRSVSAASLLLVCRLIGFDPLNLLASRDASEASPPVAPAGRGTGRDARSGLRPAAVTHETAVKHPGEGAR